MIGELQRIAGQCDGLRCDMAMLVVPEVFERTWRMGSQPFWPKAIAAVRHAAPGLQLHGRGLLGHGVGAAAAGLRPHLRQASVRPAARAAGAAGARTPVGRPGLPGQAGALPREPRRAARGRHLRARGARRRRGAHLLHAWPALLSPGPAGRPPRAHLAAPGARSGRAGRCAAGAVLCAAARRAAPPAVARRRVVAARVRAGMAGQPECGAVHRLALAGAGAGCGCARR